MLNFILGVVLGAVLVRGWMTGYPAYKKARAAGETSRSATLIGLMAMTGFGTGAQ